MYTILGCGMALYGRTKSPERNGYIATKWFCLFWFPLIPFDSYIVYSKSETDLVIWTKKQYQLEKLEQFYRPHLKYLGFSLLVITSTILSILSLQVDTSPTASNYRVSDAVFNANEEGIKLLNEGDYEEALLKFTEALKQDSKAAIIFSNRALTYYYMGEYEKALVDYTSAIKLYPDEPEFYTDRGDIYWELDKTDSAIADYQAAIMAEESYAMAHFSLGLAYYFEDDLPSAIESFSRALKHGHDRSQIYYWRAYSYYYNEDFDNALNDADNAIRLDNNASEAYLIRGLIYDNEGYLGVARDNYLQYLATTDSTDFDQIETVNERLKEIGE